MNMRAEPVTYDLPMPAAQDRLMKAIRDGREGFVADDLARLNSGTIAADKIEALFEPNEIKAAVARRRQKLIAELKDLDRLVPRAEQSMLVSGDRKVVDDAVGDEDWDDLDAFESRQMGGDPTTRRSQEKLKFERSLQALRDAADLLKK